MKDAKDVIPWKVTDLALRPYEGYWSFNPSIHFDGQLWRCVLRCCDYAMPDGVTIRSKSAGHVGQQTKNAMVILDPTTWRAVEIFKMHELDRLPRESCPHVGYEDMRLFRTDTGGLQGIAASLHLRRERRARRGLHVAGHRGRRAAHRLQHRTAAPDRRWAHGSAAEFRPGGERDEVESGRVLQRRRRAGRTRVRRRA